MSRVARSVQAAVRFAFLRTAVALSPRMEFEGFEVADLRSGKNGTALMKRVGEVIRFIVDTDSVRARRIRQDLRRIVVMDLGGSAGGYLAEIDACALDPSHVEQQPIQAMALILVHEATHARIRRAGIRYDPEMRGRIERICINEEIAFAGQVENGAIYIAEARRALDQPWWSVNDERKREERQLRALGWPEWTLKFRRFFLRHED